jgi:hypothetical protein
LSLWTKSFGRTAARVTAAVAPSPADRGNAGEYELLYKYLRDRYAVCVVLTFGEIEDLLGFSLPESARLEHEWWSNANPTALPSAQSQAWTLASRTATVNMAAQSVIFERGTTSAV